MRAHSSRATTRSRCWSYGAPSTRKTVARCSGPAACHSSRPSVSANTARPRTSVKSLAMAVLSSKTRATARALSTFRSRSSLLICRAKHSAPAAPARACTHSASRRTHRLTTRSTECFVFPLSVRSASSPAKSTARSQVSLHSSSASARYTHRLPTSA